MTRKLLEESAKRAIAYLETIDSRPVRPDPQALTRIAELRVTLPKKKQDPHETLRLLDEIGSPASMAMNGPRFFGFVIGGSLPVSMAANWLSVAWDQNACFAGPTPFAAALEDICTGWFAELFGLPKNIGSSFVTGATMANFTALCAARYIVLKNVDWDVQNDGLFGAPPITVIVGDEVHPSAMKGISLLGIGHRNVVRIPVDKQGRMRADKIPKLNGPTIVCLQAGNVNTGAFDPFADIIPSMKEQGAFVHVDGAFGLWAAASPKYEHLTQGMQLADSWATDAHKWLNVPYDSGVAFVRDPAALRKAMAVSAAYLPSSESRQPSDFTPELSRRARGVEIWAALRTLGKEGVQELVDDACNLAKLFETGLKKTGYEVLNDVVLNQLLVSFGDAEKTKKVVAEIQNDGTCWCGPTVWQGKSAMRISVSNFKTTKADVEKSVAKMLEIANRIK